MTKKEMLDRIEAIVGKKFDPQDRRNFIKKWSKESVKYMMESIEKEYK